MGFVAEIAARLSQAPTRTAFAEGFGAERRLISAGTLLAWAGAARERLAALGIRPGARVVLIAPNCALWVAADLAVLAEGGVLVPFDPRQGQAELARLCADADPALILSGVAEVPTLRREGRRVPILSLEELCSGGAPWEPVRELGPSALATVIYTSGSSGRPKGACLTRQNLGFMLAVTEDRLAELSGLSWGGERALHYLPLCYAGSRVILLAALLRGARIELLADPARLGEALPLAQADYFLNVPLVLERFRRGATQAIAGRGPVPARLLAEAEGAWTRFEARREAGDSGALPAGRERAVLALAERLLFRPLRARFGGRLRGLICGSAPLSPETQRFFRMCGLEVYQGYGLTETTALCTLDLQNQVRPGWVGPPLPEVELRIEGGELWTRGPHVFAGYRGRPQATAEAFASEGWFRTGDLAVFDAEGRVRVLGRKSALLVLSTGHNVPPEAVEEALAEHLQNSLGLPDVGVVVCGHGRSHLVGLLATSEQPEPGALAAALTAFNAEQAPARRVQRLHLLGEAFTAENGLLTANLKTRRSVITKRFAAAIEALYTAAARERAESCS